MQTSNSRLILRNVITDLGRTSMRLEPEMWDALEHIGKVRGTSVSAVVREALELQHAGGRTSAVRVFILNFYRDAAAPLLARAA